MSNVLIFTSPAHSIKMQGRYIASVLTVNGHNAHVYDYTESTVAMRYVNLHSPRYIINVMDPFQVFTFTKSMIGSRGVEVITYYTADGVPYTDSVRNFVRGVCRDTYVIANSQFSRANLESIDCHISEVIPNGIDYYGLSKYVNQRSIYTFTSSGFYNPGINEHGSNWMHDRKGYPALLGLLYRLWREGFRFTMWLNSSPDVVTRIFRALTGYAQVTTIEGLMRGVGVVINVMSSNEPREFITINGFPTPQRPIRLTYAGSVKDVGEFYASGAYYISNSYIEGFGLTPFEALASGRYVIVNDLPTFREFLPNECSFKVPIHAVKDYVWGCCINKMLMRYHIPDFSVWRDVLIKAISGVVKYDPRTCSESVRHLDYRNVYGRFVEMIN